MGQTPCIVMQMYFWNWLMSSNLYGELAEWFKAPVSGGGAVENAVPPGGSNPSLPAS